jgi:hypothetical protein
MAIPAVIDPGDWLEDDGSLPSTQKPRRQRALRIARFIEYGGLLVAGQSRQTLIECLRRPRGQRCVGLMWVIKTAAETDAIDAFCPVCLRYEARIVRWQNTLWADGVMEPLRRPAVHPSMPESVTDRTERGASATNARPSSGTVVKDDGQVHDVSPTSYDGIVFRRR